MACLYGFPMQVSLITPSGPFFEDCSGFFLSFLVFLIIFEVLIMTVYILYQDVPARLSSYSRSNGLEYSHFHFAHFAIMFMPATKPLFQIVKAFTQSVVKDFQS